MKEQFVTYEIALKLKELGFNEKCLASYYTDDERNYGKGDIYDCRRKLSSSIDFDPFKEEFDNFYINSNETYYVSAPLWQQAIDWFLSQYNIWIIVDTSLIKFYKNDELQPLKFQFVIEDLNNRDADYMFHSADEELFYFDYKYAREQAILKAIELCQNKK